jgi:APA family basic amino acid/polyamine antiporter
MTWAAGAIALGAVFATTSVLVVFQLGQPRIFFSMARDGLLPAWAARIHPRYRTPHITTWITGILVAFFAAIANLDEVVQLTNIGTLFAFILVCVGVTVLRIKDPGRERHFKVPFGPWLIPALGAACCLFLMIYLPPASWWRFVGWLVLGAAIYSAYGYGRSVVGRAAGRPAGTPLPMRVAAAGFLAVAIGLFVIPHDLGPVELAAVVTDAASPVHARAMGGALAIAAGTITVIAGFLRLARR